MPSKDAPSKLPQEVQDLLEQHGEMIIAGHLMKAEKKGPAPKTATKTSAAIAEPEPSTESESEDN